MKRRTKIIATIGPATESPEMMENLIKAGMSIARLNMAHARPDQVQSSVITIREISRRLGVTVGILMDTQGPAIRTGELSTDLKLKPGDMIALTVRGEQSEEMSSVDVNYDGLVDDIQVGDTVLVDNGEIHLKVIGKRRNQLSCQVLTQGTLGSRRHINLPGVRVNLPALTDKDIKDIELGIEVDVDFFAMSFVREAEDVKRLKAILDYRKAPQKVIAKIEDQEGAKNYQEIIEAADGVMIARGDLGIEVPYEELPIIQRRIVKKSQLVGKPVIVATHMLESMIENPSPTRAEITDVANAVFEEADAIMLSGESSVGKYPLKCLEIMNRIAIRTERSGGANYSRQAEMKNRDSKLVKSGCLLAEEIGASAIVVFTRTGSMARRASWLRPNNIPIYAFTPDEKLQHQMMLFWGVTPFQLSFGDDPSGNVERSIDLLLEKQLIQQGQWVVIVSEIKMRDKLIDTIQIEKAG